MDRNTILVGATDMHLHCAPDTIPRKMDALELAQRAKNAGMKAILLKSHAYPTAPLAMMVEKAIPGVRVFGGLTLNESVGAVNPEAVKTAIALGAKAIWMPTISARNHVQRVRTTSAAAHMGKLGGASGEGIYILDASGQVIPEVLRVIALVKEVGPESTIISSDLGQVGNPDPLEGFRDYAQKMLDCGISDEALHLMIRENPSRLLGI